MIMVKDSTRDLNRFLKLSSLNEFARGMVMRVVLTFMLHRGRMSCSQAGGAIRTEPVHRSQITRFLARTRRQKDDFNEPLRKQLLALEFTQGRFLFCVRLAECSSFFRQ